MLRLLFRDTLICSDGPSSSAEWYLFYVDREQIVIQNALGVQLLDTYDHLESYICAKGVAIRDHLGRAACFRD